MGAEKRYVTVHTWKKKGDSSREQNNNVTRHVKFAQHDAEEGENPGLQRLHKLFGGQPHYHLLIRSLEPQTLGEDVYTWTPANVDSITAKKYLEMLPSEKRPVERSEGDLERQRQLQRQLPVYDLEPTLCDNPTSSEMKKHREFLDKVKAGVVGVGVVKAVTMGTTMVCSSCGEELLWGQVGVCAERLGTSRVYHPACFSCKTCHHLIADLIYFHADSNIYCGRHYAEKIRPRCSACDELIFAKEYTQAEGQNWHVKHFCCWRCDKPLAGNDYMPYDSKPYCMQCYQANYASNCRTCYSKIAPNSRHITLGDHHWHARPQCFKCSWCHKDLLNTKIVTKQDRIFCSMDCKNSLSSDQVTPKCVRQTSDSAFPF